MAVVLNNSKNFLYFLEGKDIQLDLNYNNKEKNTEELWKSFFKTIAIKERENRKCQQNRKRLRSRTSGR